MDGEQGGLSRRGFAQRLGQVAAASTLATLNAPAVHAAEDNTIQVALVGCGGRGTGAAADALSTKNGPIKLVAMADVFEDKLTRSHTALKNRIGEGMAVKDDRKFVGFDGYKKAMDCLKPGDVVILATPPAFRWVHFELRHREGPQRLHGEAGHRRRPDHPEDARARRRVGEEEPQGRRRPDVPALRRPQRTATTASRTARSATSSRCAPTACTARPARRSRHAAAARPSTQPMTELLYQIQQLPQLPVGQRRRCSATSSSTTSTSAAG